MSTVEHCLPLNVMHPGQKGRVQQVLGRAEEVHRLEEMGLRKGALVEMLQTGSPCIVKIGEQRLCFRAAAAISSVLVEPEL